MTDVIEILDDKEEDIEENYFIEEDDEDDEDKEKEDNYIGLINLNDDDDDDDEDDDDFNEVDNITKKIIISKKQKKTFNILTKYEKNYIMGVRINQIINGSPIFVDFDSSKKFDIFKIVEQELLQKKIPFKIKRKLPNGNIELWDLEDLIII